MILLDTGPIVAFFDASDHYHPACIKVLKTVDEPLVTTWPVLTEAFYLLNDTDVLVWYMLGNEKAKHTIQNSDGFSISVVTYIELVQGLRNKEALNVFRNSFKSWNAGIIYITEEISIKAMFFVEQYFLSHSLQLADALVGATAMINGLPLLTANSKYYKIIKKYHSEKIQTLIKSVADV